MGDSLTLMRRHGKYSLSLRRHDLGGTEYQTLCSLTELQAHALAGPHTGLFFLHEEKPIHPPVEPRALHIFRRPDRPANTRAWSLCVGPDHAAYVSDEAVRLLQEHANPVFEPGEPNWATRDIEDLDDQILAAEEALETLRKRRQMLQDALSADSLNLA